MCGNVGIAVGKFHATEHAVVAMPLANINVEWLYYQLKSMNLNQYATGTAQPGLSVQNINNIPVSVPTSKQQQKIASEIKSIETKIAELEKVIADIPSQKELILKKYLNS